MERAPYLFPLKSSDFIQDILLRYASANIQFKLSFKRNASPSRFAQRKRLLRTTVPPSTIPNAYEQLRIQESLIRRQHEIITQLRKTSLSRDHSRAIPASNYDNYFDWVTRQDDDDDDDGNQEVESDDGRLVCSLQCQDHVHCSSHCRSSSDSIPVCRRQSRQDDYLQAVHREAFEPIRSLSRVRFRPSTVSTKHDLPSPSIAPMRSILKKSTDEPISQRSSSVDRDITRLTSLKQRRHSVYTSDDADDDNLSDRSTTDSCLGSLSSNDSCSYLVNSQQLETLV